MSRQIFINYRRDDDAGFTQLLYYHLEAEFDLFMDVEGMKPGCDFIEVIGNQVDTCDLMLVVIGRQWLDLLTARADDPEDYVLFEIRAALERKKRVIPVLVGGAKMPKAATLPEAIRPLTRISAFNLRPDSFRADCRSLIVSLAAILLKRTDLVEFAAFRDVDAPWCPEMVVIPAGRYLMGSPDDEDGRFDDEGPQHEVVIAEPFAIGKNPVTFAEYDYFCKSTGMPKLGDEGWGRGNRPAINVSWSDAKAYTEWLSDTAGASYRLLSEAEWEYAARAGTTTRYWWGYAIAPIHANYRASEAGKTTPVAAYPGNPWGLFDMNGNVWEWVEDGQHDTYDGATVNGSPWIAGGVTRRIVRGGGWNSQPEHLRSSARAAHYPTNRRTYVGFRVARTLGD